MSSSSRATGRSLRAILGLDDGSDPTDDVVLEGAHAVKHALRFGAHVHGVATGDPDGLRRLLGRLAPDVLPALDERLTTVDEATWQHLAPRLRSPAIGLAERPDAIDLDALDLDETRPVLALEGPQHAGNLGACVRVAAAVDAAALVVVDGIDPWTAAAVRGGAGLQFALPIVHLRADDATPSPIARLAAWAAGRGRPIVALDPDSGRARPPRDVTTTHAPILLFGTERDGLGADALAAATHRWRLPMRDGVSSLNLATAVAAACYVLAPPTDATAPASDEHEQP